MLRQHGLAFFQKMEPILILLKFRPFARRGL
jgi:hypothetical protein